MDYLGLASGQNKADEGLIAGSSFQSDADSGVAGSGLNSLTVGVGSQNIALGECSAGHDQAVVADLDIQQDASVLFGTDVTQVGDIICKDAGIGFLHDVKYPFDDLVAGSFCDQRVEEHIVFGHFVFTFAVFHAQKIANKDCPFLLFHPILGV